MLPKNPKPQYVWGEGPSKNVLQNVLAKLTMSNKDRQAAKSINKLKKDLLGLARPCWKQVSKLRLLSNYLTNTQKNLVSFIESFFNFVLNFD
jgi:hypothetical protein